jgi:hypothetical protein
MVMVLMQERAWNRQIRLRPADTPTALATHRQPTSRNRAPQRTLLLYLINAPNRRLRCGIVPTYVATAAAVEDRPVGVTYFSQISRLGEFLPFTGKTSLLGSFS